MLIPHPKPLVKARFIARFDRFIARVAIGDREVDAHCVNTGRMEGLIKPGSRAWVSTVPQDSKRKLRYTLELLEIDDTIIGVNTLVPNYLAETVIRAGLIPGLKRFRSLQREVRYGDRSRVDLLLTGASNRHYVEVKNCHLVYPDGGAYFPDSVSARATDHLSELVRCVKAGNKASVLFVLQRRDGRFLRPSELHDPAFAQAARAAAHQGVRFTGAHFDPQEGGFLFLGTVPVDLQAYSTGPLENYRNILLPHSGWRRRGKQKSPAD